MRTSTSTTRTPTHTGVLQYSPSPGKKTYLELAWRLAPACTIFLLAGVTATAATAADEPIVLTLDLSSSVTFYDSTLQAGKAYKVKVINALPAKQYQFRVHYDVASPTPLSWPEASTALPTTKAASPCPDLENALTAMSAITHEKDVLPATAVAQVYFEACADKAAKAAARSFLDSLAFQSASIFQIEEDGILEVSVSRERTPADAGFPTAWAARFAGPRSPDWFVTYGVNSVHNGDQPYNALPTGTTGTFEITRAEKRHNFNYAGAIFFSWAPIETVRHLNVGLAAGLGFDLSDVQAFIGPVISFNKNISLVGGGAFHKVQRLRGEFQPLQQVSTALSADALNEKVYSWNWFFGVSFRFDKNPFSSNTGVKATPDAKGSNQPSAQSGVKVSERR